MDGFSGHNYQIKYIILCYLEDILDETENFTTAD